MSYSSTSITRLARMTDVILIALLLIPTISHVSNSDGNFTAAAVFGFPDTDRGDRLATMRAYIDNIAPVNTCPTFRYFPAIQIHDIHPAHDMGNAIVSSWADCRNLCCQTTGCAAFFHTSNQSSIAGNCTGGGPCCWLK